MDYMELVNRYEELVIRLVEASSTLADAQDAADTRRAFLIASAYVDDRIDGKNAAERHAQEVLIEQRCEILKAIEGEIRELRREVAILDAKVKAAYRRCKMAETMLFSCRDVADISGADQ